MKMLNDFLKVIAFLLCTALLQNYMMIYIETNHFSSYSIAGSIFLNLIISYFLYKVLLT